MKLLLQDEDKIFKYRIGWKMIAKSKLTLSLNPINAPKKDIILHQSF